MTTPVLSPETDSYWRDRDRRQAADRARRQVQVDRWHRRVDNWPLAIVCPIERGAAVARRTEAGNAGLRYRCDRCGLVFVIPTAQVDRKPIRQALGLGPVPR